MIGMAIAFVSGGAWGILSIRYRIGFVRTYLGVVPIVLAIHFGTHG